MNDRRSGDAKTSVVGDHPVANAGLPSKDGTPDAKHAPPRGTEEGDTVHWTDADGEDVECWHEERVEAAGGPLFFHAEHVSVTEAWIAKVREVCRGA